MVIGSGMADCTNVLAILFAALPPAERALRVAWSGQTAPGGYAALDRSAQRAAVSLTHEPLTQLLPAGQALPHFPQLP